MPHWGYYIICPYCLLNKNPIRPSKNIRPQGIEVKDCEQIIMEITTTIIIIDIIIT